MLILALSYVVEPWIAFLSIVLLLAYGAHQIVGASESDKERPKDFEWFTSKFPILGKLKQLELIVLVAKVVVYSLLSFLLSAVFINAALFVHMNEQASANEL